MFQKRTHTCGELDTSVAGQIVILLGWVARRRDHGGLIFIDLRDRNGITQVVFNPEIDDTSHALAHQLRNEYVIEVVGCVQARPKGTINPNLFTGEIEVIAHHLKIINTAKTPPFALDESTGQDVSEDTRLRFRYIDLRRHELQKNFIIRHRVCQATRTFLDKQGFLEIETPFLIKSTPEGARDFLVPSRLIPGSFFALPQSPQIFKQILMCAGFERYFQIVKCFRDEDLRADRQPEFTQIDIEMSFVDEQDIFCIAEGLIKDIFKAALNIDIKTPIPQMPYQEAMNRYGSDKPDIRFDMELVDISHIAKNCQFKVFAQVLANNGCVKGIRVPDCAGYSRGQIDALTSYVSIFGAKGLAFFKVIEKDKQLELDSTIAKFFTQEERQAILSAFKAQANDLLLFVADSSRIVSDSLGNLRLHLAKELNIPKKDGFHFLWIIDHPLLEYDKNEQRYSAVHHPFTSPQETDYHLLDTSPDKVKARAYDLVLNGVEIGGGSIRIHQQEIQKRLFNLLSINEQDARVKFGFLLDALSYGSPPHGGIAFGLDRLMQIIVGASSIRDVIAFPKTQSGACLMSGAPYKVDERQLRDLCIRTTKIDN